MTSGAFVSVRSCDSCGTSYTARRPNSRFCSDTCRKRWQRGASAPKAGVVASGQADSVYPVVRAELEAVSAADTTLGRLALTLAGRIDAGGETAGGVTALAKELRSVRDEIRLSSKAVADPVDELNRRRLAKLSGA